MKYTDVVWDFNGTILNDVDVCIGCANKLLRDHSLPELRSKEHYLDVFGFPIIEYYERIGFDFDVIDYDELAKVWVKDYLDHSDDCTLYPGVIPTLERLRARGLGQLVLSATEIGMLTSQLKNLGVFERFDGVYGIDNIHAASKLAAARRLMGDHPDSRFVLIGDTEHDLEAADAIGADCVLVAAGHQPKSKLVRTSAVYVADTLAEACDFILLQE